MNERGVDFSVSRDVLHEAAKMPYNSIAGIYRICGAPVDVSKYGTDCVGKINYIIQSLHSDTPVSYLATEFGKARHLAAVVDGCYIDPFLFQTEPASLSKLDNGGQVTVGTLAADQKIRVSQGCKNMLNVALVRLFPDGRKRTLIEYNYDTDRVTSLMPDTTEFTNISLPYMLHFVTKDGFHIRVVYDYYKNRFNIFMFSHDGEKIGAEIDTYCEKELKEECSLSLDELRQYFVAGNDMQKYLQWWKKQRAI